MDIPAEILTGAPRILMHGYGEICIENHRGLLEYGENEIHINGGDAIIKLLGENFHIKAMTASELQIEGKICQLTID